MLSKHSLFGFVHSEVRWAQPIQAGQWTVTPVAQNLRIDFPRRGGLIWNRPTGVLVRAPGGEKDHWLPIPDLTRRAQIAIWAGTVVIVMIASMFFRRRSE
jgi:hypothetical protein